ncbi:hypothetical protein HAX54_045005, partial [Datura stramonium]|nr:hypothetical protein [Datura stramonium]
KNCSLDQTTDDPVVGGYHNLWCLPMLCTIQARPDLGRGMEAKQNLRKCELSKPSRWVRATLTLKGRWVHLKTGSTQPKPLPFNPKICTLPSFFCNPTRQNPHFPFLLKRAMLERQQILLSSSQLRVT